MTIETPEVINTTRVQDGQAAGSITPSDARVWVDSAGGAPTARAPTASTTALLTDRGSVVEMNVATANNYSIPTNASVAFDIGTVIEVYQMGAGQTTIVAVTPGTTTIRPAASMTTRQQYVSVSIRKRATDEWVVGGDYT